MANAFHQRAYGRQAKARGADGHAGTPQPGAQLRGWPKLIRFMSRHAAGGAGLGALATTALIVLDFGGLGGILREQGYPALPIALLFAHTMAFTATVCASIAVMTLPSDERFPGEQD